MMQDSLPVELAEEFYLIYLPSSRSVNFNVNWGQIKLIKSKMAPPVERQKDIGVEENDVRRIQSRGLLTEVIIK